MENIGRGEELPGTGPVYLPVYKRMQAHVAIAEGPCEHASVGRTYYVDIKIDLPGAMVDDILPFYPGQGVGHRRGGIPARGAAEHGCAKCAPVVMEIGLQAGVGIVLHDNPGNGHGVALGVCVSMGRPVGGSIPVIVVVRELKQGVILHERADPHGRIIHKGIPGNHRNGQLTAHGAKMPEINMEDVNGFLRRGVKGQPFEGLQGQGECHSALGVGKTVEADIVVLGCNRGGETGKDKRIVEIITRCICPVTEFEAVVEELDTLRGRGPAKLDDLGELPVHIGCKGVLIAETPIGKISFQVHVAAALSIPVRQINACFSRLKGGKNADVRCPVSMVVDADFVRVCGLDHGIREKCTGIRVQTLNLCALGYVEGRLVVFPHAHKRVFSYVKRHDIGCHTSVGRQDLKRMCLSRDCRRTGHYRQEVARLRVTPANISRCRMRDPGGLKEAIDIQVPPKGPFIDVFSTLYPACTPVAAEIHVQRNGILPAYVPQIPQVVFQRPAVCR